MKRVSPYDRDLLGADLSLSPAENEPFSDAELIRNGFVEDSHTFRKQVLPDATGVIPETFNHQPEPMATIPPFVPRMGYTTTPPPTTPRAELLREAEQLITGDRNETYGTPTQNFSNIAAMLNVQFAHKLKDGVQFTGADVSQIQMITKLCRMIAQPKRDNYVDIAGYAACGWEVQEQEQ